MAANKKRSVYVCNSCGASSPRWAGQCSSCGAWNTLVEMRGLDSKEKRRATLPSGGKPEVVRLGDVEWTDEDRRKTGIGELDRVLGGGIVPGSLVLIGGDPGIGKSTLMLQMCARLHDALYVSGEESLVQIRHRAARLPKPPLDLKLLAATNVEQILDAADQTGAGVLVIDSIQTMYRDDLDSAPGSVAQVRECAALLMRAAKDRGISIFLVGHVTKDGMIAGPKVLEHMVDTVLQFEGEQVYAHRIVRAAKNRFGSTNEIGVFEMSSDGMTEVKNPSLLFLGDRDEPESGTAVVAAMEGARPLLIEVQALVARSGYGTPQRGTTGYDAKRLQMILAVLEKRMGLNLAERDVFVNVAGGLRLDDPAVDLGIAAAIVSSYRDVPLRAGSVLVGELGLTGEVRTVTHLETRIREAAKLGFTQAVVPRSGAKRLQAPEGIKVRGIDRVVMALTELFGGAKA